jgi:integrase
MGNIRSQPSGKLYFDFRYLGKRCREITALPDTEANRKRLETALKKIEAEILMGQFDYAKYFPTSKLLSQIRLLETRMGRGALRDEVPTFAEMTDIWLAEHEVEWREHYRVTITNLIRKHILPDLGEMPLDAITRDVLVALPQWAGEVPLSGRLAALNGVGQPHHEPYQGHSYRGLSPLQSCPTLGSASRSSRKSVPISIRSP